MSFDPDAFNAFESAGWSARAGTYEELAGRVTAQLTDHLLDAAGVVVGTRLLDVGAGPGHLAACAASRGAVVTGVDISDAMVEEARSRHPGIEFRTGSAEQLPFTDSGYEP